ncbi:MAG: isoaspartyl peptidase/L-asparaginase [Flavobacteriaceae bacterium]|nr:isoaspartyl peptidase/L-asparaginase [Candidatus Neomarinimicrobiota bacterium]MBT4112992.1 isoaspartyl peptidase/L-asparaginase [Flavobacteriaceae bacterium]MBT5246226.1 isoaspartyl peptidase/L-asparaginase [Flavobacteriaceae bacterium]MBT5650519.1 isoaspartyl peptidase/L-asparaginase [Flavobacteriaceae bacterium]MBT5772112.1 isoaspartyl peptidase/L-asparaginase [Flavobacteriaceae bacterium]
MRFIYFIILLICFNCKDHPSQPVIAIHGGAGIILKGDLSIEKEKLILEKLDEAISHGYEILKSTGSSTDAVVETIKILENSPLFNAGKGAVFTNQGTIEHDASIMSGENLNAGASTGTKYIKNPITLAHSIMTNSEHVFLSREGAEEFAKLQNLEMVEQEYFFTDFRFNQLKKQKNSPSKFGTVGCVAMDINGNLAAGTSTGGMTNKKWGRIGDSPIIGAGTYANNKTCAISCTGSGEYFMRSVVAYDISALMEYKGLSLKEAVFKVIHKKLPSIGGDGGLIAIDNKGNIVMDFNTPGMYRASINKDGEKNIAIYLE